MEVHPGGILLIAILLLVVVIIAALLSGWLLIQLKVIKKIDWAVMLIVITVTFVGICLKMLGRSI